MRGVRVQTLSNRAVALLVAGGVLLVDQLTKSLALAAIDEPVEIIGDFLRLRIVRNPGAAFGRLTGVGGWLALGAVVITVVLILAIRRADSRGEAWALGLILGGALGNLVDRLFRGSGFADGEVVDFIDFSFWPTFNVADAAITIGVLLALVGSFLSRE